MKKSNILITNKVIDSLANDVCIMVDQDQNQALCQELTVLQGHFDFIRSIDTGNLTDQHVAFDIKKTLIDHEAQPLKDIFDWKINQQQHDAHYITIPKKTITNKHDKH